MESNGQLALPPGVLLPVDPLQAMEGHLYRSPCEGVTVDLLTRIVREDDEEVVGVNPFVCI